MPVSQCCGFESESERIRRFGRIRIQQKKFGFGFRYRYWYKLKLITKNQRLNTWKRTKCMFFSIAKLFSMLQVPEDIWTQWEPLLWKLSCPNPNMAKKNVGSDPEKNIFGSTTLQSVFFYLPFSIGNLESWNGRASGKLENINGQECSVFKIGFGSRMLLQASSVSNPHSICIRWPPGSGSLLWMRIRIRIQEA
jgi:hypothetical protein